MSTAAIHDDAVLESRNLCVGYGDIPVVRNVDITVRPGEVVVLLGANGVGKTTMLKCLAGILTPSEGEVRLKGAATRQPLHKRARNGLGFVSDERSVIMSLSVADNLRLGGVEQEPVFAMFPTLEQRLHTKAGLLSGGEQQMLTLGRLLARNPDVVLADEVSLGLAPLIVRQLLATLRSAADEGTAALIVEQHVRQALEFADRVYVMQRGEMVFSGTAEECNSRLGEIERAYLGAVTANA
jgi:branched-chain amino acid transport system ATP-binding protein